MGVGGFSAVRGVGVRAGVSRGRRGGIWESAGSLQEATMGS